MIRKGLVQVTFYALVALILGYLSASPNWTHMSEDQAMIKVSFSHGADRKVPCRKRTREELMALPPNMRKPMSCERERLPVYLEISLDGEVLVQESLKPMGLAGDGQSQVYRRITIAPGTHRLRVGIRDTHRNDGFDYLFDQDVVARPRQNLVIDFEGDKGIFLLNSGETS